MGRVIVWLIAVCGGLGCAVATHHFLKPAAPEGTAAAATPRERRIDVLHLLEARKFDAVEQRFTELQRIFETKPWSEDELFAQYQVFEANPALRPLLDEWIAARPDSDAAVTARAWHLTDLAWERRGAAFAAETTDTQKAEFAEILDRAAVDANKALELNPRSAAAYMAVLQQAKGKAAARGCLESGSRILEVYAQSYRLWRYVVTCLEPRWGGTYEAIEKVAQAGAGAASVNPRLTTLLGFPHWARGRDLYANEKYEEALAAYDEALKHGVDDIMLEGRFNALLKLDLYARAMADAAALQEHFPSGRGAEYRDIVLKRYKDWAQRRHRAGALEEAVVAYTDLLVQTPDEPDTLFWRAQALLTQGKAAAAVADLTRVLALEPGRIEAVKAIDRALAPEKRWPEILAWWDQYLAQQPEDGEAYLERGGTHFNRGDLPAALADAERACKFGKEAGCVWAARVRQRMRS